MKLFLKIFNLKQSYFGNNVFDTTKRFKINFEAWPSTYDYLLKLILKM